MYNRFETLQEKCKKYYIQRTVRIVLPIVIILTAFIFSYNFFTSLDNQENINIQEINKKQIITKTIKEETKIESKIEKKDLIVEQKPKINEDAIPKKPKRIIKDVEYDLEMYSYNLLNKKRESETPRYTVITKTKTQEKKEDKQPFSISLKQLSSTDDLIKSFNKESTYLKALRIAESFYEKKDYENSLLWSKKANKLNSKDSKAWLLYAKSEYAGGNRQRAKDILKMYIKSSNSQDAKELLISWIEGK